MAENWDNGLKTPVNGSLHKNFEFGPLFGYQNFQNQIDTWETTVQAELRIFTSRAAAWSLDASRKFVQKYIVRKDFWIPFPGVGTEGMLTFQKEYRDQHISHGFLNVFEHYLFSCEKVTVKRSFCRPH